MSEHQSENQKETLQKRPWIDLLTPKFILTIGGVIAMWIAAIILSAKGNNCFLSIICSSNSNEISAFAEFLPIAVAGGTVFLMTSVFGMSILPALGLAAVAFGIAQFIH